MFDSLKGKDGIALGNDHQATHIIYNDAAVVTHRTAEDSDLKIRIGAGIIKQCPLSDFSDAGTTAPETGTAGEKANI